ncbi:hypothetical protein Cgig2_033501 [Carnegiea gigantea]|uniref:Uncharacterized protein n=1 Tax=Carnegiea gigantea TaxID=171969 RepID=A0A9Q1Q896_9CARY|nr:hypothetical protein Cgig2_033501 [Carnegiea gigantea]
MEGPLGSGMDWAKASLPASGAADRARFGSPSDTYFPSLPFSSLAFSLYYHVSSSHSGEGSTTTQPPPLRRLFSFSGPVSPLPSSIASTPDILFYRLLLLSSFSAASDLGISFLFSEFTTFSSFSGVAFFSFSLSRAVFFFFFTLYLSPHLSLSLGVRLKLQ